MIEKFFILKIVYLNFLIDEQEQVYYFKSREERKKKIKEFILSTPLFEYELKEVYRYQKIKDPFESGDLSKIDKEKLDKILLEIEEYEKK